MYYRPTRRIVEGIYAFQESSSQAVAWVPGSGSEGASSTVQPWLDLVMRLLAASHWARSAYMMGHG